MNDRKRLPGNSFGQCTTILAKIKYFAEKFDEATREREQWEKEHRSADVVTSSTSSGTRRRRRSISSERFVETLVVVDREMMEFYQHEDVTTYVLTVMNMVRDGGMSSLN